MKTSMKIVSLAILAACSTAAYSGPKWTQAEQVFNTYEDNASLLPVAGYVSNWGGYERSFDINDIEGKYDKLVYSFMALCGTEIGDPTITSAVKSAKKVCADGGYPDFTIVFTDPFADLHKDLGAGSGNWVSELNGPATFEAGQEHAGGLVAVLREMKKRDPGLELAFSVGGWSLSEPFSRMASTFESRKVFVDSAVKWFTLYPMFDQLDIDWEYPGGAGASENSWSPDDGKNYALLIKELRMALDAAGMQNKKIAIAAGAPASKLDASNIKALIDNGLDYVHLMTYDFMGEWQDKLAHHTNLSGEQLKNDDTFHSAEKSIDYMIDVLGIPSTAIQIGYANYSRNAGQVNLQSVSPLIGSFTPGNAANKSYDTGSSELYDYANKLVSFKSTGAAGMQGYEIYTDIDANADFLFNKTTKQYVSVDTPRTVYAKAAYAKKRNLGGIFNWMVDHDPGYHINAAREGLGYKVTQTKLDMTNVINTCGLIDVNGNKLTEEDCKILTGVKAGSIGPIEPPTKPIEPPTKPTEPPADLWDATKIYRTGDIVTFENKKWRARNWAQGGDNPKVSYQKDKWGNWEPAN
ncbi:putative Chitinase [Vibrio nigripulchritudo SFn118]|nr:putative Chitinase [Vibrio nigripulchritudo SFn118]